MITNYITNINNEKENKDRRLGNNRAMQMIMTNVMATMPMTCTIDNVRAKRLVYKTFNHSISQSVTFFLLG